MTSSAALSYQFGETGPPTHSPIRNGSAPQVVASWRRQHLGGADQRGRALELLGGEQPQRVAHQHRDARLAAARVGAGVDGVLQPPDRERVRGQPEVGLGLAAAGREEQQVDLVTVLMPPGRSARAG